MRYYISKPSYPYNTIMKFWINNTHYSTIITLLLHLWHFKLQKSEYYDTLWKKAGKDHYYTYDMTIITIMTFWIYYDTYVYYDTITTWYPLSHFELLLHLWHWGLELLLHIMTIAKHHVHYIHYELLLHLWH